MTAGSTGAEGVRAAAPTAGAAFRRIFVRSEIPRRSRVVLFIRLWYPALTVPVATWFLFYSRRIHPSYGMTWRRRLALAWRLYRNTTRVFTGMSYRAHVAMAVKLLEIPPSVEGVVVECGCYLGGSTVNLSLICDIVGRDLIVYDSFEGLPASTPGDSFAPRGGRGQLAGPLEVVRENVRRFGEPDRCTFRRGWFADTLPDHVEPIVLMVLDVDYQASLHDCILGLWPHLTDEGYLFCDDYTYLDLVALFFSERFWSEHFDRPPPGLLGGGTGIGVGQYWLGPYRTIGGNPDYPAQSPGSTSYTRKDFRALWDYEPPTAP